MSPLLLQSKAADVRHDRWLVRPQTYRSSSREGGDVTQLNLRSPRAAVDEGGDADTNDHPGLLFKAGLLRSAPLPLIGSRELG
jgi:hypothetical protein